MKTYIALDSGGTKVLAIRYDEDFRIRAVCRVGSLRPTVTSEEMMQKNVDMLMEGLGLVGENVVIHNISGTIDGILLERMQKDCTVEKTMHCGELALGLASAAIFGDGMLALSGTGCMMSARYNGRTLYAGGYGAIIADTGSGYWMGRHALEAAIAYNEERGEPTLLKELITEHFGEDNFHDSVYSIYSDENHSPSSRVASVAPLVSKAAYRGDKVALEILKLTGRVIGEQMRYLIKSNGIPADLPITISGSIWRGHEVLFNEFNRVLHEFDPARTVIVPEFEPIVGAVIRHYYEEKGKFDEEDRAFFREEYAKFSFAVNSDKDRK